MKHVDETLNKIIKSPIKKYVGEAYNETNSMGVFLRCIEVHVLPEVERKV